MAIAGDQSPDASMPDVTWLEKLPSHPVFAPAKIDLESPSMSMAIRNTDILVGCGDELRMASLLEVKHASGTTSRAAESFSYTRLRAARLDFTIENLIVNPTGKLLAVVGSHQVAIVVLPRSGALAHKLPSTSVTASVADINVKAAAVGPYYHHSLMGNRAKIAKAQWHPWGSTGNSLLIMTRDGALREYDAEDVDEPAQTLSVFGNADSDVGYASVVGDGRLSHDRLRQLRSRSRSQTPNRSFVPSKPAARERRSTSKLAFDDDSDSGNETFENDFDATFHTASGSIYNGGIKGQNVVSFTLGLDLRDADDGIASDWNPLTVYALCSTGDIYALCPFMPRAASLPSSYLHSLASSVSLMQSVADGGQGSIADTTNNTTAARFVAALLKEASAQRSARVRASTPQKPRRAKSATPMSVDLDTDEDEAEKDGEEDEVVDVHCPDHIIRAQPLAQGPFLLAPAPHELSEEREANATDIFFARYVKEKGLPLNIVGIASDDGRIDLCLALDSVRPRWNISTMATKTKSQPVQRKTGRYALSDSEEDDEVAQEDGVGNEAVADPLPMLLVYESIDLDIGSAIGDTFDIKDDTLRRFTVRFTLDPLYSDTVYVQHVAGAHAIAFGRWAGELSDIVRGANGAPGSETDAQMQRMMHQSSSSDVAFLVSTVSRDRSQLLSNPVASICIVSDIYLCYSLLALAGSGSLAALELNIRIEDESLYEDAREADASRMLAPVEPLQVDDRAAYISLLDQEGGSFDVPEPFKSFKGLHMQPKVSLGAKKDEGELRVTPESLRSLASSVHLFRGQIREIVQGGNTVQARLELQMEELKRQLGKMNQIHERVEKRQSTKITSAASNGESGIAGRIRRIMDKQETIAKRSDRLLQRLIESHSPELDDHEVKWLTELDRLQSQLGDKGKAADVDRDSDTITSRLQALRHQLDEVKRQMNRQGGSQARASVVGDAEKTQTALLSTKQLRAVEEALAKEAETLDLDRSKIMYLNSIVRRQVRSGSL